VWAAAGAGAKRVVVRVSCPIVIEIPSDLHPACVPVAFLLGAWEGAGRGDYPTIEKFQFRQHVTFTHNGKPYLEYLSRTWLLDDEGNQVRPLAVETGFWRPQPDKTIEVLLAHPTGIVEIWIGEIDGAKIELRTDAVARTATAKEYTAGHRLYGLVQGELMYAYDMAAMGQSLQPHLWARLKKIPLT
jgi:THAP4-like, heme-binding beta-barrel domain